MAGPCWTSPSPRIRLKPDAVKPASQLDFFQQLRAVELTPPATAAPESIVIDSGVSIAPPAPPAPPLPRAPLGATAADDVILEGGTIRVWYVPHERARRYRLMFRPDGTARCTVPRRGSLREARRFVDGVRGWLARQWQRRAALRKPPPLWQAGTPVWFRGTQVPLEITRSADGRATHLRLADVTLPIRQAPNAGKTPPRIASSDDLRPAVERTLRGLAEKELRVRVQALAESAGIKVARIAIRNQRTRWGSCSPQGAISLNWRLIQTPDFVRDYIILHELAHRRHLNHSGAFWDEVARMCPAWETAEAWIKQHSRDLL